MKIYPLENFNKKELGAFCEFINKYDYKEHIHIILNSQWGETWIKDALISLVNMNPNKFSVTSIIACSSAFLFLLGVKCPIKLMEAWYSMAHKGGWDVHMRDWFNTTTEIAKFQKQQLKEFTEDTSYLNKKEQYRFDRGQEVFFWHKRMWDILLNVGKKYDIKTNTYFTPWTKSLTETQSRSYNDWLKKVCKIEKKE